MGKNIDSQLVEVTKSQLDTAISNSALQLGVCYKITDRGDRGITLTAISNNKLSLEGIRTMLCPKTYKLETLDTNVWKGVWHSTKTAAINDLMIWGGLVWKNLTGVIGTATNNIALDAVNWIEISKSSFTNNEYIEIIFNIDYDYENDWITKQRDKNGNEFGCSKETYLEIFSSTIGKNPVDISDWNYTQDNVSNSIIANNVVVGIFNNVEGIRITGNIFVGNIYGNYLNINSYISNNYLRSATSNLFIRDNIGGSIYANNCNGSIYLNNCNGISNNISNSIFTNIVSGSIQNNICGNISANTCSNISGNSIKFLTNSRNISSNTVNNIIGNTCERIQGNINGNNISYNQNNGEISFIDMNGFSILNNNNNGNITNTPLSGDVTDTIVNK